MRGLLDVEEGAGRGGEGAQKETRKETMKESGLVLCDMSCVYYTHIYMRCCASVRLPKKNMYDR